ncbi:MAG: hypothetical protein E7109_05625 [Bacteroidales bacterium]|nr:hypothetical protein [Bacteroidales bacterium]
MFCGALCLTGCLKNIESDSVTQVRLAKANQLKAEASLLQAQASAETVLANAQAEFIKAQAGLAFSYYFRIPAIPALRPYVGLRGQFSYASASLRENEMVTMGASVAEGMAYSLGVLTGVDYYFSRHFFVGASVEPFRYTYGVVQYRPQEGLSNLGADTHFMGAFAAPQLKIGFVF